MRFQIESEERTLLAARFNVEPDRVEDALYHLLMRGPFSAGRPVSAQVTVEDLRREFYAQLPSMDLNGWSWIRTAYLEPAELIVDDDQGTLYRVPFEADGDAVTFGTPERVRMEFVAATSSFVAVTSAGPIGAGTPAASYANQAESRELKPPRPPSTPTPPRPPRPPAAQSNGAHMMYLNDCEAAIAAAIRDDKFSPHRAEHYRRRWHRDPAGTARLLARLTPVPGLNSGAYDAEPAPTDYPREWLGATRQPRVRGAQD